MMLTHILTTVPAPRPASSHILNQSTVGVGLPAGVSGTTDRGASAGAPPVASESQIILRDHLIAMERQSLLGRLIPRRTSKGGDAA